MGRPMLKVVNGIGEATLLFFLKKYYIYYLLQLQRKMLLTLVCFTLQLPHHRFEQIRTPTLFQKPQNKLENRITPGRILHCTCRLPVRQLPPLIFPESQ